MNIKAVPVKEKVKKAVDHHVVGVGNNSEYQW